MLQSLIGDANGANVSFYAIDVRGLSTKSSTGQASELRAQPAVLVEYAVPDGARRFRATARLERPYDHQTQDRVRVLTVVGTESNEDMLLGLPVEAPEYGEWLSADAFDPAGHPLEAAGIRVDRDMRPVGAGGRPLLENVFVVGTMLAGQRYLRERCRDGVSIASGRMATRNLAAAVPAGASRGAWAGVRQ